MPDEKIKEIKIPLTAAIVSKSNAFCIIEVDDEFSLLATSNMMLSLDKETAFKMQCRLEIPNCNFWYFRSGKNTKLLDYGLDYTEQTTDMYFEYIQRTRYLLEPTNVRISTGRLYEYTHGGMYTLIDEQRLEMIEDKTQIARAGNIVIINSKHILVPMQDKIWQKESHIIQPISVPLLENKAEVMDDDN